MAETTFTVNTDNHVVHIPGIGDFEFEPEVDSDRLLDARVAFTRAQSKSRAVKTADPNAPTDAELDEIVAATKAVNTALRDFISSLMIPASATAFAKTKMPDRTLIEMQNWVLEQYGLRPTGSSSGSATPSATTPGSGNASTGGSDSEVSTP